MTLYHGTNFTINNTLNVPWLSGDIMNCKNIIDPIVFLQVHFIRTFMARHGLTIQEFLALDKDRDIIGFLRAGYEPFHLTGDEGVLKELDAYVYGSLW